MINSHLKKIIPKIMRNNVRWLYWRYIEKGLASNPPPQFSLRCRIAYNEEGAYCVPESSIHCYAAQRILANRIHEGDTLAFLKKNAGNGDIISAGTYFGDFLPALSSACGDTGKVWAFEPNIENFQCANITIMLNNLTNIVLSNAALGSKSESLSMETTNPDGIASGGTSKVVRECTNDGNILQDINVVCIDDVIDSNTTISIIQLDIEGFEKEALEGALKTIERCKPIIVIEQIENANLSDSEWFHEYILSKGYHLTQKLDSNYVYEIYSA